MIMGTMICATLTLTLAVAVAVALALALALAVTLTLTRYAALKRERAKPLWAAVEKLIPDIKARLVVEMVGTPLTHERFLRRTEGTCGNPNPNAIPIPNPDLNLNPPPNPNLTLTLTRHLRPAALRPRWRRRDHTVRRHAGAGAAARHHVENKPDTAGLHGRTG